VTVVRILHDFGILLAAGVCAGWQHFLYFLTCKCCAILSCKCFCSILLLSIAVYPVLFIVLVIELVLAVYLLFAVIAVLVVYGGIALVLICMLLFLIYVLVAIIGIVKWPVSGQPPQSLCEFYEGVAERLKMEFSVGTEELENNIPKLLVTSHMYATIIPVLCVFLVMLSQFSDTTLIIAYAGTNFDETEISTLGQRAATMPPLQAALRQVTDAFGSVSHFLHFFFVEMPEEIPAVVESAKKFLDKDLIMVYMASMLDLGSKFENFKKGVFALRFCTGLLRGPLRLLETLAKYDHQV